MAGLFVLTSMLSPGQPRAAPAQTAPATEKAAPVFVPGYYQTESRNSRFPKGPARAKVCVDSVDYQHFRDETVEQYRASPQFNKACKLGGPTEHEGGFILTMTCKGANHVLTFHFEKDLVWDITESRIKGVKAGSSTIKTTMRRIGECPKK